MIALLVLAAAAANVSLVVFLADRFGGEGVVSAGELTSLQATGTAQTAPAATRAPANENVTLPAGARLAA